MNLLFELRIGLLYNCLASIDMSPLNDLTSSGQNSSQKSQSTAKFGLQKIMIGTQFFQS